jgi:sphingomyelin phosphodiesterase
MSPTNAFPPTAVGKQAQWVYDLLSSDWSKWIGSGAASEELSFGSYSVKYPGGNLRMISINTNLYYIDNYWLFEDPMESDPSGQLAWLVSQLDAAEKAGERVYIIGHMPMGESDAFRDGSNYFDQIVNRYSATIAAMFFGRSPRRTPFSRRELAKGLRRPCQDTPTLTTSRSATRTIASGNSPTPLSPRTSCRP